MLTKNANEKVKLSQKFPTDPLQLCSFSLSGCKLHMSVCQKASAAGALIITLGNLPSIKPVRADCGCSHLEALSPTWQWSEGQKPFLFKNKQRERAIKRCGWRSRNPVCLCESLHFAGQTRNYTAPGGEFWRRASLPWKWSTTTTTTAKITPVQNWEGCFLQ